MSLYTVSTGATINATDINQAINVLQQPSGGQEGGKYFLTAPCYANNASIGAYVGSRSRGATPVSVSIDTTDQSPSQCNSPSTDHLTANGFHVYTASTGVTLAANVGGNYTIQY